MSRAAVACVLTCALAIVAPATAQSSPNVNDPPAFEAATIKPPDSNARFQRIGFYGEPGGRVYLGVTLKMLLQYAFDLQDYSIAGGPAWSASQRFEINAVPPEGSASRNIKVRNAQPTAEQRLMLQRLLRDRFAFQYHWETKTAEVYLLSRATRPLMLRPPKDTTADPRVIVMMRQGGIADGEALGINATTEFMATRLSRYLQLPVLDRTGLTGAFDFSLPGNDPENQDVISAVNSTVERLGLKLKRDRGPVRTLVIDHVEQPSEN